MIGYSMGGRIILKSLEQTGRLKNLKQIYLLGAAVPHNFKINRAALPSGARIVNYHSPSRDQVLAAFQALERVPAAGAVGFGDPAVLNYRVSATHIHKGVGIHSDYTQMAEAIAYRVLWHEGRKVPGKVNFNLRTSVGQGTTWWNNVVSFNNVRIKGERAFVTIQQHNTNSHFRAVAVVNGERTRVAWSSNMHAIMSELGLFR